MVNYSTAKIYKLHSISHPELGIYIGSTTNTLSRRLSDHRSDFKRWQAGKYNFVTSYTIFGGADDVVITLIEAFACESKDQLLARERYWIEMLECVNKVIPGRTHAEYDAAYRVANRDSIHAKDAEYRAANRDQILAYQSEYRETHRDELNARCLEYYTANKDAINSKRRERLLCECGCTVSRSGLSEHRKTQIHRQLMREQALPVPADQ